MGIFPRYSLYLNEKRETTIPVVVNAHSTYPPPPPSRDVGCSTDTIPPQFCEEADEARLLDELQPMDCGPYAVSLSSWCRTLYFIELFLSPFLNLSLSLSLSSVAGCLRHDGEPPTLCVGP